jgi:hypothetical protein
MENNLVNSTCCTNPHYVESSNHTNIYCVHCGTIKSLGGEVYYYWTLPPNNPYSYRFTGGFFTPNKVTTT